MGLARRSSKNVSANIWPGFVDAMTALLLVLIFVLTIFMVVQFVLRETISGKDRELDDLNLQLSSLATALGLEQQRAEGLSDQVDTLQGDLSSAQNQIARDTALIATLNTQSAEQQARIASFEDQVASLLSAKADLESAKAALEIDKAALETDLSREISAKEAVQLALAQARTEIDEAAEQARLAAAKREALDAMIADLQSTVADTEADLASSLAALTAAQSENDQRIATEADLKARIEELAAGLSEEEKRRLAEAAAAEALRERLRGSQDEISAMQLALEAERQRAEDTLTLLAAAELAKESLTADVAETLSEAEKQRTLVSQANALLDQERAISAEGQRKLALLNQQTQELRQQLNALQALLDASDARDIEAQVQIEALGSSLNAALAQVASEQRKIAQFEREERARLEAEAKDLRRFKSEFFAQLRDILGAREGVRIVGDRFVFSSEVLFDPGRANLGPRGQEEIRKIATRTKYLKVSTGFCGSTVTPTMFPLAVPGRLLTIGN
jgi:chemotaxis protein MotB